MEMTALRHIRLLAGEIDVLPISLETSQDERDWYGRVERLEILGRPAYRVFASDFRVDRIVGLPGSAKQSYVDHLVRIAGQEGLTALHVYGGFELRPFVGAVAAARTGLPLIVSFRGSDIEQRIYSGDLAHFQAALQVAELCVCMNTTAQRVIERLFNPRCPVRVVHNHVDPENFDADARVQLDLRRPVVGCVGEFRRVMGLDFLLQAFAELESAFDASLLLVGPFKPTEAIYYSGLVDNLKYSQRVHRIGTVEHSRVLAFMKACDVLAFPSISDGSPNKILEAMLAGCAVVAADVGGIPELIRDGIDGVLVPPRDSVGLASALAALLKDEARRRTLGESARARVLAEFTPAHERAAWMKCYKEAGAC
jgi:glycosyltransferase involved in cell wall biosynthesis